MVDYVNCTVLLYSVSAVRAKCWEKLFYPTYKKMKRNVEICSSFWIIIIIIIIIIVTKQ
jgi:hypothetical protein